LGWEKEEKGHRRGAKQKGRLKKEKAPRGKTKPSTFSKDDIPRLKAGQNEIGSGEVA
jgi:hypothetical protein